MSDADMRDLSRPPLTVAEKIGLIFAVVGLFLCVVFGALAAAGIVDMNAAQIMLAAAWIIAVGGAFLVEKLSARSRGQILISASVTAIVAGALLFTLNAWMVRKKAEQEHRPPPNIGEWLLPVVTYMQSLPWKWIAISLTAGLLIAAWPLISLLRTERKRAASETKELQGHIEEVEGKRDSLDKGIRILKAEHEFELEKLEGEKATLEGNRQKDAQTIEQQRIRIERLQEDAITQSIRVSAYESDVQRLKTKYEWVDEIVEYQRNGLRKYVLVEKCDINPTHLSVGKRFVEFTFTVFNYSMFGVSIPMSGDVLIEGSIYFKGDRLSGAAKLIENKIIKLPPYHSTVFKIHQWVDPDEAKDITDTLSNDGNLFDFSKAVIYVKADKFPEDEAAKLDLSRGMQNAEVENKFVKLGNANARLRIEISAWKEWAGIIAEMKLALGACYQAYNQAERGEALSEEALNNLKMRISHALSTMPNEPRWLFEIKDELPPTPDSIGEQQKWIDSLCFKLREIINEQWQRLSDYVQNDGSTPTS
jgi:hypothetical protein